MDSAQKTLFLAGRILSGLYFIVPGLKVGQSPVFQRPSAEREPG